MSAAHACLPPADQCTASALLARPCAGAPGATASPRRPVPWHTSHSLRPVDSPALAHQAQELLGHGLQRRSHDALEQWVPRGGGDRPLVVLPAARRSVMWAVLLMAACCVAALWLPRGETVAWVRSMRAPSPPSPPPVPDTSPPTPVSRAWGAGARRAPGCRWRGPDPPICAPASRHPPAHLQGRAEGVLAVSTPASPRLSPLCDRQHCPRAQLMPRSCNTATPQPHLHRPGGRRSRCRWAACSARQCRRTRPRTAGSSQGEAGAGLASAALHGSPSSPPPRPWAPQTELWASRPRSPLHTLCNTR